MISPSLAMPSVPNIDRMAASPESVSENCRSPDPRCKLRLGLFGTPLSSGNLGVQALAASLVHLSVCASPNVAITFFGSHRSRGPVSVKANGCDLQIAVEPWRMDPSASIRQNIFWIVAMSLAYRCSPFDSVRRMIANSTPWIQKLTEMDMVGDIRGGDSFSDIYGLRRFFLGFLSIWSAILVNRSVIQLPQTYGPYKTRISQVLARFLLRRSRIIIARDRQSQIVAMNLLGSDKEVLLSPDVAFALESAPPTRIELTPVLKDEPAHSIVGINVNGLMFNGGYTRDNMFRLKLDYPRFLTKLISDLLLQSIGEVWLIPHTFAPAGGVESDPDASGMARDALTPELQRRVRIVTGNYDQHEIKGIIGKCDFFIGSRMHACIAALSQGIPTIGVAYSMKFAGVFESVGMTDWVIDAREANNDEAIDRAMQLYSRRDEVRALLRERSNEARNRLGEVFLELFAKPARTWRESSL